MLRFFKNVHEIGAKSKTTEAAEKLLDGEGNNVEEKRTAG
jgi:hypothetical protein